MPVDISGMEAEVAKTEGVVPSAVALINGIADQIAAAVAADNVVDATNLSALQDRLRAQADALAAAVASAPTP